MAVKTIIMGAAGRDFHDFNVVYRDDPDTEVVAFTAAQIPNIAGRRYPAELAGPRYPAGIPIHPEAELESLVRQHDVRRVVFAYSDVAYATVMHHAALINATGADFTLLGAGATMLRSATPVIAVCAVRTGAGKSQTTRRIAEILRSAERRVAIVRHPMPYGDLVAQRTQRFASLADTSQHRCTIEELEEYEPLIAAGHVVFAGVDYGQILAEAEQEADVILWDGGNNDLPFYRPDFHIVLADPLRVGNELGYYPGEANLRMADLVVINKVDTAGLEATEQLRDNIRTVNARAPILEAASPVVADRPERVDGARVLIVEDGPTVTHGEMRFGAGTVAARKHGAREIVDPRPYAVGAIAETFATYPAIGPLLPAMGYSEAQVRDLEATIARVPCDLVVIGTPIDLTRIVTIERPIVRVRYELQELGRPSLDEFIGRFLARAAGTGHRRPRAS
jgi:predicted GTPase